MNLSLRNKIFILVTLPTIGLLAFIILLLSKNYNEYRDASASVDYVNYSNSTSRLIHELQRERGLSALFLGGKVSKNELIAQRIISIDKNKKLTQILPTDQMGEGIRPFTLKAIKDLEEARQIVDKGGVPSEATALFGISINQLILSEIYIAQNAQAFGHEKKLLSVAVLELAKEFAGKLRANITNIINLDKALTIQQSNSISFLLAGLNENLNSPTLIITKETREALEAFKESPSWKSSQVTIQFILENAEKGSYGLNSKIFFTSISDSINEMGKIIFTEQDFVRNMIQSNKEAITTNLITIFVLNLILLSGVFFLSVYFVRSITKPIQFLMETLSSSSTELNGSSLKVSAASEQLSQNSIQQASALQEAVASLEEITLMIAKTAENAKTSQDVSTNSFLSANNGKMVVSELGVSITEISDCNGLVNERVLRSNLELQNIAEIISDIGNKTNVINDIVFQTKLLSFNASVEAARAGEHGKGFAVVAEEVGNLAAKSGHAAKEIKDVLERSLMMVNNTIENTKKEILIVMNQSQDKISFGSLKAIKCGDSLTDIVEKVQEVNKLIAEIATAGSEQSLGMRQISLAMQELDKATNSNSASSVETAKYGQVLQQQASSLNSAIGELAKVING